MKLKEKLSKPQISYLKKSHAAVSRQNKDKFDNFLSKAEDRRSKEEKSNLRKILRQKSKINKDDLLAELRRMSDSETEFKEHIHQTNYYTSDDILENPESESEDLASEARDFVCTCECHQRGMPMKSRTESKSSSSSSDGEESESEKSVFKDEEDPAIIVPPPNSPPHLTSEISPRRRDTLQRTQNHEQIKKQELDLQKDENMKKMG